MFKHVAILLRSFPSGGVEKISLNLANEFSKNNIRVDIVLFEKNGEMLKNLPSRYKVYDLKGSDSLINPSFKKKISVFLLKSFFKPQSKYELYYLPKLLDSLFVKTYS